MLAGHPLDFTTQTSAFFRPATKARHGTQHTAVPNHVMQAGSVPGPRAWTRKEHAATAAHARDSTPDDDDDYR